MNFTGMEPDDIAANAGSAHFQAALLEHLLRDETLLLTFCGNENIDPALIEPARHLLLVDQKAADMRIGIDLGGTKISVIALEDDGSTSFETRVKTPAK